MARGSQTPFYLGLSALFYFALLFSPLAFVQTAHAQEESVQESYGTGMHTTALPVAPSLVSKKYSD
jgi:hypothetical protein